MVYSVTYDPDNADRDAKSDAMEHLNVIGFDTRIGYKTVELCCGDLMDLDSRPDVLVVSAFKNGYEPRPGTVFGALRERFGIRIRDLAESAEFRLDSPFNTWVSGELGEGPAKRVLCVEIVGADVSVENALENVFATLALVSAKGVPVANIAMSLLGTGNQALDSRPVAQLLLSGARQFLDSSVSANTIRIVEIDPRKARLVSDEIDVVLGREKISIDRKHLTDAMCADLINKLAEVRNRGLMPDGQYSEWVRLLQGGILRSTDFGVCGRLLIERMLSSFGFGNGRLFARIRAFEQAGHAAPWICAYMHVLRQIGNESVHSGNGSVTRIPEAIEPADLNAGIHCVIRLLDFWLKYETSRN